MKTALPVLALSAFLAAAVARAEELRVSAKEPLVVVAPAQWKAVADRAPGGAFPFETYRVTPPAGHNAVCLISVFDKDHAEFADPKFLQKLLRGDSRPYVNSPADLAKLEFKELTIQGGRGFYKNFVDPDLVGKPVKAGSYKTATPVLLGLGTKYLLKATILCDEIDGADYREMVKVVESIRIK